MCIISTRIKTHRVKCHKILSGLSSTHSQALPPLIHACKKIPPALVIYLRSLEIRALHRHRKGVGSIFAGGPIVDEEFLSTVLS